MVVKRRKNVKLFEITIPAQVVRIEATMSHVALNNVGSFLKDYDIKEVND